MKRASFFLMASVLFAVSCAQELQENDLVSDKVMVTKALNNPEGAIEGNLIVKISEDAVNAGYESLMCQISENMEITKDTTLIINVENRIVTNIITAIATIEPRVAITFFPVV